MRSVADVALDMMMDVSQAKNEDDQTIRLMKQIEKRDLEIAQSVHQNLQSEVAALKVERDSLQKIYLLACFVVDPEAREDVPSCIEAMRQEICLHQINKRNRR